MDWETWRPVFTGLTGGLIAYAVISWQSKKKVKKGKLCRTAWIIKLIFLLGCLMFGVGAVTLSIPNFYREGLNDEPWLQPVFLVLTLTTIAAFFDSLTREIIWSERGIRIRKFAYIRRFYPWSAIINVKHVAYFDCYRITFSDGEKMSFYEFMQGSAALLEALRQRGVGLNS